MYVDVSIAACAQYPEANESAVMWNNPLTLPEESKPISDVSAVVPPVATRIS